ncbi:MAG TPA: hypothetical protein VLK78_00065, partial [Candidatus Angelobacter sp.]|nr:hypothetical protein [Candidatus Angelobacter sp.]
MAEPCESCVRKKGETYVNGQNSDPCVRKKIVTDTGALILRKKPDWQALTDIGSAIMVQMPRKVWFGLNNGTCVRKKGETYVNGQKNDSCVRKKIVTDTGSLILK